MCKKLINVFQSIKEKVDRLSRPTGRLNETWASTLISSSRNEAAWQGTRGGE